MTACCCPRYGIVLRACAPIFYDSFDGTYLNANTAVLARSDSGKFIAIKCGVKAYVIDSEGEYAEWPAPSVGGPIYNRPMC